MFKTHRYQLILYALLIKETYKLDVNKAFLCYTRSNNKVIEVKISEKDINVAIQIVNEILGVIQKGICPKKAAHQAKCIDCCYRNICA